MDKKMISSTASLANAVEVSSAVLLKVAGNSFSDQVGGEELSTTLRSTLTAKIKAKLAPATGVN